MTTQAELSPGEPTPFTVRTAAAGILRSRWARYLGAVLALAIALVGDLLEAVRDSRSGGSSSAARGASESLPLSSTQQVGRR